MSPTNNTTLSYQTCNSSQILSLIEIIESIGYGKIVPAICLIGILFNLINLIVLLSPQLSKPTYVHLTGLAVADLASLILFGLNALRKGRVAYCQVIWAYFVVYVYYPVGVVTTTASVLLTITVSWERYVLLSDPHCSKRWKDRKWACRLVFFVWLLSALCNLPRFFVVTMVDSDGSTDSSQRYRKSTYGQSVFYLVLSWLYFITLVLGTSAALIVINGLLIRGLRRLSNRRSSMVSQARNGRLRRDDLHLTWMLVVIVFVFLIGEIPSACVSELLVVDIFSNGNKKVMEMPEYRVASLVAYALVVSQHSMNFVVYCLMNKKFASALKSLLCFMLGHRAAAYTPSTSVTRPNVAAVTVAKGVNDDGEGNFELQLQTQTMGIEYEFGVNSNQELQTNGNRLNNKSHHKNIS